MLTKLGKQAAADQIVDTLMKPEPVIVALDAPASVEDVQAVLKIDERSVRRRAVKFGWAADGHHHYPLSILPETIRRAVVERRRQVLAEQVQRTNEDVGIERLETLPVDYTPARELIGRCRADYVLAVYGTLKEKPHLTRYEAVRVTVRRAETQHPLPFTRTKYAGTMDEVTVSLWTSGRGGKSQLALTNDAGVETDRCAAITNFERWDREWSHGPGGVRFDELDDQQFWVLCPKYKAGGLKKKENYWGGSPTGPKGDQRFWQYFRMVYVTTKAPTAEQAYLKTLRMAHAKGWQPIALWAIRYYLQRVMTAQERSQIKKVREGGKTHYDRHTIYILRDWRRVQPDECWSFDGHLFDVWCRYFDPVRQAWFAKRPWLVNCIDSSSWFELGRHFTFTPALDSVELAIRHALLRYKRIAQLFYFDNGREYKAAGKKLVMDQDRMLEVCANLHIDSMFALPYNPRAKVNERDYRNIVWWFEVDQPTYAGNAAVNKSNWEDRRREMHRPGGPLERIDGSMSEAAPLRNWQLVPTLEEFAARYDKYREEIHHQRVRQGKICSGQSPAGKYLAVEPHRRLTDGEIALSFLRYASEQQVGGKGDTRSCPRVSYKPPGVVKDAALIFEDEALVPFIGEPVVLKVDHAETPIRCFVFRRERQGLQLIKCSGPFGSIPLATGIHPFRASSEDVRSANRRSRGMLKKKRAWREAEGFLEAEQALAEEVARERGITPGQAKTYVLDPGKVNERVEHRTAQRNTLADVLDRKVSADKVDRWTNGEPAATTSQENP